MIRKDIWKSYAEELLARLRDSGLEVTPELEDAFWAAPRHLFIDGAYTHDPSTLAWWWQPCPENPETDPAWLERVYEDTPLVISLDDTGMPCSSNSAPSVIFRMLTSLELHPGDRVLEIGTGTGQLSALIACLVTESGEVVSLELDPELARTAQAHIAALLPGSQNVKVTTSDARTWQTQEQRFDVIVSTASCWPLPAEWLSALAPGGRICVELRGRVAGALLFGIRDNKKSEESCIAGQFSDELGAFMPLRSSVTGVDDVIDLPFGFGVDELTRVAAEGLGERQLLSRHFDWYCQLELPDARPVRFSPGPDGLPEPFLLSDGGLDAVRLPEDGGPADSELIAYGGTSSLLERLTTAWKEWHALGKPSRIDYLFFSDHDGNQRIELKSGQKTWRL